MQILLDEEHHQRITKAARRACGTSCRTTTGSLRCSLRCPDRGALSRYYGAVATIQVREVPEEMYEVLRRRARRAGQSMQAYLRDQLVELAGRPTKEEAIERIEAVLGDLPTTEPTAASVVADLNAERR